MTAHPRPRRTASAALSPLRPYGIAVLLGAAVGGVSVVFLAGVIELTRLVWERLPEAVPWLGEHPGWATVLVCTTGGVLVGLVNRGPSSAQHTHEVHDLDQALAPDDKPATAPGGLLRLAVLGVVSLGFGASLGPEAPLVVIVSALAVRLQGVLRLTRDEAVQLSVSGALGGLFGSPLGAVALPIEKSDQPLASRLALLGPSIAAGVSALWVVLSVLPDGSLHPFTVPDGLVEGQVDGLLWATLAAVVAAGGGLALHAALPRVHALAERVGPLVLRGAVGGLVLGVCGAISPLTLFSGHHEIQELLDGVGERTGWVLVGLAALKALATLACLGTGWFGGEIFPAAMIGTTLGLAVAEVSGTDAVAACAGAGMVAACAVMLRRPVAALLMFLFFLPPGALVAAALGAGVGAAVLAATEPDPLPGGTPRATPEPGGEPERA